MPLDHDILTLRALLDSGEREGCARALSDLREHYRREPEAFDPAAIRCLREIAGALKAAPRTPPADAPDLAVRLKELFGYEAFRPGQEEVIRAVLAGRDCLGVMPTGAGKSLTYQLPARLLGGTTLVISPLIALMKDQVDGLTEAGLRATFLNSSLEAGERLERIRQLRRASSSWSTRPRRASSRASGRSWTAWTCASSRSTRPIASASGATTSGPPTGTWPGSRPGSAACRCWP